MENGHIAYPENNYNMSFRDFDLHKTDLLRLGNYIKQINRESPRFDQRER